MNTKNASLFGVLFHILKKGLPGLSGCELLLHTSSFQMVAAVIPHCVCPLHLLVLSGFIAALLHTMASLNFIRLNLL
jgi:hypothetical protein